MAKTKQTAQRSTGGSGARRNLEAAARERERAERRAQKGAERPAGTKIDYILYEGRGEFRIKFDKDKMTVLPESEIRFLTEPLVRSFCRSNRGYKVTSKTAVWWGLLDGEVEEGSGSGKDFTVRFVMFDPALGVEGEEVRG